MPENSPHVSFRLPLPFFEALARRAPKGPNGPLVSQEAKRLLVEALEGGRDVEQLRAELQELRRGLRKGVIALLVLGKHMSMAEAVAWAKANNLG